MGSVRRRSGAGDPRLARQCSHLRRSGADARGFPGHRPRSHRSRPIGAPAGGPQPLLRRLGSGDHRCRGFPGLRTFCPYRALDGRRDLVVAAGGGPGAGCQIGPSRRRGTLDDAARRGTGSAATAPSRTNVGSSTRRRGSTPISAARSPPGVREPISIRPRHGSSSSARWNPCPMASGSPSTRG